MLKPIFALDRGADLSVSAQWRSHFKNRVRPSAGSANVEFKAAADGEQVAEIYIYDEIGFWGISASDFVRNLMMISAASIDVHINSPGGDVFDGISIYNALRAHPAKITCYVDGIAASAASFIALAGDKCIMAETAMMMIHKAWGLTIGNEDDHLDQAIVLGKIDDQLASIYAAKTGKTPAECKSLMKAETWMTGKEAVDMGFCDEISNDLANPSASVSDNLPKNQTIKAATEDWKIGASRDLPIDSSDSWDGAAAKERMFEACGMNGDSPDMEKLRKGFLAYDASAPDLKGSYKLPFADMIGGEMQAVAGGIRAAASRLPQTDIPEEVKTAARAVLDAYEKKMSDASAAYSARRVRECRAQIATRRL